MTQGMTQLTGLDVSADCDTLYRDGIVALKGAFPRDWVERMREDMMTAFWEAIQRPGGAVCRGPRRWYVEIHPQAFSGFIDRHVLLLSLVFIAPLYLGNWLGDRAFDGSSAAGYRRIALGALLFLALVAVGRAAVDL